jgi:transcriptional regulator with GAF, ATPase, and Fis domain/tetratricopeptide (TPR) repeat protein/predicted Ser/Thr protein kinase
MWAVERRLDAGGSGEIYLARTPSKERVALKCLRTLQPSAIALFEKEILLLSKLKHPHIVSILGCQGRSLEIFGEERGPCYWMEFVEGENLLDATRTADADAILLWLVEALEALQYLHAQGVLHGDISPRNLLISRAGGLKILDFGLAAALGESAPIEAATLPYLAPERIGGMHTAASDLFSLGTVFYEALAGRHPRSSTGNLHDLMSARAPSLLESAPALKAKHALACRVIDGMIQGDLSSRFAEAGDVLDALRGGSRPEAPRRAAEYHSLVFWGADSEMNHLKEAIRGVRDRSAAFVVHGMTGVGKKRFLREAAFQCALAGLPVVERYDGSFLEGGNDSPDAAYFFRSIEALPLSQLSRLLSLRRRGVPPRGRLIFLEWNDDFVSDEGRAFLDHVVLWPEVVEIRLRNLDPDQALSLLRGALGPKFSQVLAERLIRQTGGNPGLLIETAGRILSGETGEDLESLGSRRELLLWKVLSLPEAERGILAAVAACETPVFFEALARFTSAPHLPDLLRRLQDRQCLQQDRNSGGYRLALPLLTEILKEVLQPSEATEIHRRWLHLLKDRPSPDLERLHHAIALKDEPAVITEARPTADLLWSQERKKASLRLVDRCLEVVQDRVETARLLKEKMSLLADAGLYEDALATAEGWFALGPDNDAMPLKTVKYWFFTAMNHQNLGDDEEAGSRLRRCLELGDAADVDERPFLARAHSLLGALDLRRGALEGAKAHLDQALGIVGAKGRRRAEIFRNLADVFAAESDAAGALRALQDARALYEEDRFDQGVFACHLQEGNLALKGGDTAAAESAYARAEEIALRLDNDALFAQVWHNRGVAARRQGRPGEALRLLQKALEIFEMLGLKGDLAECRRNLDLAAAAAREAENLPSAFRTPERTMKKPKEMIMTTTPPPPFDWEPIVARLSELDRELLRESDMDIVLRRLMDSAMELARAQHGFLLLKSETADTDSPIPGFSVAVARNMNRESLKGGEQVLSLSVIHRAMESGEAVATDNALQDPRFRDAQSVHLGQLKSILALPVKGPQGILGVFYLDHPLKDGLFQGDILRALRLFEGLAALALQKGRMIEELKTKNENLSNQVDEQLSQMERLTQEVKESRIKLKNEYSEIIGRSPKMMGALSLVDKVTDAKVPVWIYGESGTGKEAIARALHFNSARKNNPFVTENCSALPESLLESELFGHKKGAFTHATADKKGLLHYADKGTIFLDEIADMSLNLQAKLLRFFQEGEIRPLGSHQVIKVDVRVISASNKDLRKLVAEGKFREDLFFRLNGITVKLPTLRERLDDLPLLAEHFLKGKATLAPEALRLLMGYAWPGNVRELQQTLETATLFAENGVVTRKSLEFKDALFGGSQAAAPSSSRVETPAGDKPLTPDLEKILRTIRDECYQKARAAKVLGISRRHLYTKLEQYGVSPESASLKAFIERSLGK